MSVSVVIVALMFCLWVYYTIWKYNKTASIKAAGMENYRLRVQATFKERQVALLKREPEPVAISITIPAPVAETLAAETELEYTNIAGKVPNPLEWWQCNHPDLGGPSAAVSARSAPPGSPCVHTRSPFDRQAQ